MVRLIERILGVPGWAMKIQFVHIDFLDLDLAKVNSWLVENGRRLSGDDEEIARLSGVSLQRLTENIKVRNFLSNWNRSLTTKRFRTPTSDLQEIPFMVDANERPIRVVNSWLRFLWERNSPKTVRTYAYALLDFFQYLEAADLGWDKVNDQTLVSYRRCQEMADSAHKRRHNGSRKLERNTIQLRILTVAKFYDYAFKHHYLERRPLSFDTVRGSSPHDTQFLAHLGRPQREIPVAAYRCSSRPGPVKAPHHEIVWEWVTSITNDRDRLIASLLYQTGMRREEIVLWRIADIPKRTKDRNDGRPVEFKIIGKGRKQRLIQVSVGNFVRLRHWLDVTRPRILRRCHISDGEDHGFVWICARDGHPLQAKSLNNIFTEVSEKCGISITPHVLRHSFAMETRKELYADGIANPEKVLQLLLGHSSLVTTMSMYGDISPEDEARQADSNVALLRRLESDE